MSSDKKPKFYNRLSFRLSLLFGTILTVLSLFCFAVFYMVMVSVMRDRTDSYLREETNRAAAILVRIGPQVMIAGLRREVNLRGSSDMFFQVFDNTGKQVACSDLSIWQDMINDKHFDPAATADRAHFEYWSGSKLHDRVRVITARVDENIILRIGQTMQDDVRVMQGSRRIMSFVMIAMILIAVIAGWITAQHALGGITKLSTTIREISHGNLESRVPITSNKNELDQLAMMFNAMLDRIRAVMKGMEQTNDNIAHELRSPITQMRGLAETTVLGRSELKDYQAMAASTVEECDRLLGIINTMLDIAAAEADAVSWSMAEVDLASVIRGACELYEAVAEDKNIAMDVCVDKPCIVRGDVRQLQRAIANLVDNAVKYSAADTAIRVTADISDSEIIATFSNSGPGIPPGDLPHIFNRFYRGSQSRSVPGNGLGLSLSLAIIRAHGGNITADSEPGKQTTFTVRMPAVPDSN